MRRIAMRRIASFAAYVLFLLGCGALAASSVSAEVDRGVFPLRVEVGKPYLIEASGRPFLLHGDAAWSLMVQPTRPEVDDYLDDRRRRGFNALLVNLIERRFSADPPRNAYGDGPFLVPDDFGTPNERYFEHVDWVLRRAAQKGFLVLLAPAYLGYAGGDQGWYMALRRNGTEKLRDYGRYLGRRYRSHPNILWVHGGDFNPPDRSVVQAIAEGIREADPEALATAHCARGTAARELWDGESWLSVNDIYSGRFVYQDALREYRRPERMPFFLIEAYYENEHWMTTRLARTQAYHAILGGATGQVFGNNPIWHFGTPGVSDVDVGWRQALNSPGSRSMAVLQNFFSIIDWWRLEPDLTRTVLTAGAGTSGFRAVAAIASDRSFAIAYLPTTREVTIDLGRLSGPELRVRWFDPATGRYVAIPGSPFHAKGTRVFDPGRNNGANETDWVLVLESIQGSPN
jgi:hypothetical protein